MFESLESRQFMSATMITDGTSNTAVQPVATDTAAKPGLTVRKAGGNQEDYYIVKMEEVIVSSFNVGN